HDDADAEEVAGHFERAGRAPDAARFFVRATRAASRRGDPAAALHCAERALALGVEGGERCELHLARSDAFEVLGTLEPQGAELEAAERSAQTERERARVAIDRAVWCWRT